jgi:short-subunit dehydrogenase
MNFSLGQHRAIVTGASSGIGKATALALAQAGFHLALVSRSSDKLAAVADLVRATGVEAKVYPLDLGKVEEVKAKISLITQEFGEIDLLVNNAGMGYTKSLQDTPLEEWQNVINLNLTSVLQCIQGVLPQMRQRRQGTIVNIASIAATQAFPDWGAYCVSKAGLLMLSQVLAAEERTHGIRVVTISPGAVNTPIWDTATVQANLERSQMLTPEVIAQAVVQTVLLPQGAVIESMTLVPLAGAL